MKKIKKIISIFVTFTVLTLCICVTPIKAEEEIINMNDQWITVNLISASIPTTYKKSEYKVSYATSAKKYTARIVEIQSGREVAKYNETIEGKSVREVQLLRSANLFNTLASNSYNSTLDGTFNLVGGSNDFKAYVWARMNISSGSYWRQCNELLSYGHSAGGNEPYTLEDSHSFDGTSSYPATKVKIDINGVIQVSSSSSVTLGLSYTALQKIGFSMSGSSANVWYARKTYNTSATFTLMN